MNHIETHVLKKTHRISEARCHAGDLEGNDIRRLMQLGCFVFPEIGQCVKTNKPNNVSNEEIDEITSNYSRLSHVMGSVFSDLHSRRGTVTDSNAEFLKQDLNVMAIK